MKILQADRGVDGWWTLIETDEGSQQLVHVPDDRGRAAPKPSVAKLQATIPEEQEPDSPLPPLDPTNTSASDAVDRLLTESLDQVDPDKLAALRELLAGLDAVVG